jgi:hypothetical protein
VHVGGELIGTVTSEGTCARTNTGGSGARCFKPTVYSSSSFNSFDSGKTVLRLPRYALPACMCIRSLQLDITCSKENSNIYTLREVDIHREGEIERYYQTHDR